MKKFKKFLDKKKKISSVSEEERFMYEVCTVSCIEHTMQVCLTCSPNHYIRNLMCGMPHIHAAIGAVDSHVYTSTCI